MNKKVLAVALLGFSMMTMAQKNEVKALEKAVKSGNLTNINSLISKAEGVISNADEKTKTKYYYLKAKALLSGTDYDAAIAALTDFEANKSSKFEAEINQLKSSLSNNVLNSAIEDSNNGNHESSAKKLYTAYKLTNNQELLYFSANGFISAQKYNAALPLLEDLRDKGYTGIKTQYLAINKETNQVEPFPNKQMRDLSVKTGSHSNPSEKQTPSVKAEIVKNIALIHVDLGNTEKALETLQAAKEASPNDANLLLNEANIYLKLNNREKVKESLEQAAKLDPTNPTVYLVLGDTYSELGDIEKAKGYYQKSIDLNPKDTTGNLNIASLILKEEEALVKKMNTLGTSAADNKKYDALQAQRNELYKKAVPYLEKILSVDSKNIEAAKTLKNIYSVLGETDKYKKMKELVDSLK